MRLLWILRREKISRKKAQEAQRKSEITDGHRQAQIKQGSFISRNKFCGFCTFLRLISLLLFNMVKFK